MLSLLRVSCLRCRALLRAISGARRAPAGRCAARDGRTPGVARRVYHSSIRTFGAQAPRPLTSDDGGRRR